MRCPRCGRVTGGTRHGRCVYCGCPIPTRGEDGETSGTLSEEEKIRRLRESIPKEHGEKLPASFLKKLEEEVPPPRRGGGGEGPEVKRVPPDEGKARKAFPSSRKALEKGVRFHLVLLPAEASPGNVSSLSRILGIDPYSTRQLLLRRYASVVRSSDDYDALALIRDGLTGARIASCIIPEEEISNPPPLFESITCVIKNIEFRFRNREGEEEVILPHEVELMVSGMVRTERGELKSLKPSLKFWSRSEVKKGERVMLKRDRFFTAEDFKVLDIYRGRDKRAIRIRSDLFDFSCLMEDKTYSSLINMDRFVALFLRVRPDIAVDTNFRFIPAEMVPLSQFLPPEILKGSGNRFEYRTNLPRFQEYSLLIYMAHLFLKGSGKG